MQITEQNNPIVTLSDVSQMAKIVIYLDHVALYI